MTDLPWTPDFCAWGEEYNATGVSHSDELLTVAWCDQAISEHHALLLRENCPDPGTIHPLAREMCLSPTAIDANLTITGTRLENNGAVSVSFSDGTDSSYHPGWLRGTAWFPDKETFSPITWNSQELPAPPTFSGPKALENPVTFLQWLEALRDYGVARLESLPQHDGLLEHIVQKIGTVRETNFGRLYTLAIKEDPDSQAFTSDALLQHIDLPTRETPCGLQFLFTRENSVEGGEGTYVDAYRIAEDMRREEPHHYESLCVDCWEYNNRAKDSDYRAKGPVIETDHQGNIRSVRYNTFLRAPLKAPPAIQARAYKAYRAFCTRAQDEQYLMNIRYRPGDLLAFDNRRVLHGRREYRAASGSRYIEGLYSDRDDLYSRIRTLKRQLRQEQAVDS